MAYGLLLYKEIEAPEGLHRLEVYKDGYTGDAIEIDGLVRDSITISKNASEVSDAVVTSVLTFSLYDTGQLDYAQFFTPNSTLFKVVYKMNDSPRWTGFITPDSYTENLASHDVITLTARDNLGRLNDYNFSLANGQMISARQIILAGLGVAGVSMDTVFLTTKVATSPETILAVDGLVNTTLLVGMTWHEAVTLLLEGLGLTLAWNDANRIEVRDITQAPSSTQSAFFISKSGYRMIRPAWKNLTANQDYALRESFYEGEFTEADCGTGSTFTPPAGSKWSGNLALHNPYGRYSPDPDPYNAIYVPLGGEDTISDKITYSHHIPQLNRAIKLSLTTSNAAYGSGRQGGLWPQRSLPRSGGGMYQTIKYYGLRYRFNVFFVQNGTKYVLRESWIEYNAATIEDPYLYFSMPSVSQGADMPQEINIYIGELPNNGGGTLQVEVYKPLAYYNEDDGEGEPISHADMETWLGYGRISDIALIVDESIAGRSQLITVDEDHNVQSDVHLGFGQVPEGRGNDLLYLGGLFYSDDDGTPLTAFKRVSTDTDTYDLLELVARERISFNSANYNQLSGTMRAASAFYFNKGIVFDNVTYRIVSASLAILSNTLSVTAMQTEAEFADTDYAITEVDSSGSYTSRGSYTGGIGQGASGVANVENLLVLAENDASLAARITSLEDWLLQPAFDDIEAQNINVAGRINLGGMEMEYDAENNAWHLIGSLYADGFITAGGLNTSGGGGGGGLDLGAMWTSLCNQPIATADVDANTKIDIAHLPYGAGTGLQLQGPIFSLLPSGVAAGVYHEVTVDAYGRVTEGANPTTLSGYGITDALGSEELLPLTEGIAQAIARISMIEDWLLAPSFDEVEAAIVNALAVNTNKVSIGGVDIVYDAVNDALRVIGNLYADGFISAGGAGSGSGGGGVDLGAVWSSLINDTIATGDVTPTTKIALAHLPYTAADGIRLIGAEFSLAPSGVSAGTYTKVTVDALGRVTSGENPTTLAGYGITDALDLGGVWSSLINGTIATGDVTSDTKIALAHLPYSAGAGLTLTGAVFALAASGVVAGTYTKVTVDSYGRVTAGQNPTTLAGYGITDAVHISEIVPLTQGIANIAARVSGIEDWMLNPSLDEVEASVIGVRKTVNIGGIDITYDATNKALHVVGNIYADGFVSAGGINAGGGGGGSIDLGAMWTSLCNTPVETSEVDANTKIALSHLPYTAGTGLALNGGAFSLAVNGVTAGTYHRVTVDAYGRVTAGDNVGDDTIEIPYSTAIAALSARVQSWEDWFINPSLNEAYIAEFGAINGFFAGTLDVVGNTTMKGTLGVTGLASLAAGLKLTTTKKIWFGDSIYIELDGNGYLHTNGAFYSDQFVSAGGLNSSSGGGGGLDLGAMWTSLRNTSTSTSDVTATTKIAVDHIPDITTAKISDLATWWTTQKNALGLGPASQKNVGTVADGDTGLVTGDAVYDFTTAAIQTAIGNINTYALKTTTITAGTGLTGGGDLSANRTISLNAASIASLAKADTALQSADLAQYVNEIETVGDGSYVAGITKSGKKLTISMAGFKSLTAGTGLTGGGYFNEDLTIALSSATIASLAKADTALQSADLSGYVNHLVNTGGGAGKYVSGAMYFSAQGVAGATIQLTYANLPTTDAIELSLSEAFAGVSARVQSLEDWMLDPTLNEAYVANLGVMDANIGHRIWFGSHYIELDADGYLHTDTGFYSDTFISAGGANAGSGSAGLDLGAMWTSLCNTPVATSDVTANTKIALAHLPYAAGDGIVISAAGVVALAESGANAGTYGRVTVDVYGRVTSGIPVAALTFGEKTYDGSEAQTLTAADISALTAEGIFALTINNSEGTAVCTYDPKGAAASLTLTKAMVGLGNVENTALSTWAGSANITTLGTITSGVWSGTPIANAKLENSSVTIAGLTLSLGGSISAASLSSALGISDVSSAISTLQSYFVSGVARQAACVTNSLTFGTKTYDGSAARTITASDLGALTSHQSIYSLYIYNSAGGSVLTYNPAVYNTQQTLTLSKSMVGLGNVENTALSTWAGSTNITKVGTITTGTWHGSAIENAYLANSTISLAGRSVSLGGSISKANMLADLGLTNAASDISTLQGYFTSGKANYAVKDGDGNVIASTYLKLSGGTLTGDLKMGGGNYGRRIYWGDGSYCYIGEDTDDVMTVYAAKGLNLLTDAGSSHPVNIGSSSYAAKVNVYGDTTLNAKLYLTSNAYLEYNASNSGIHASKGIYSDYYITAGSTSSSSDARLKKNCRDVVLAIADIAKAPAVEFDWVDETKGSGAGSIAQYWEGLLPQNVKCYGEDGMLSMEYGNIALLASIMLARGYETHEQKIARLERRVAYLEGELQKMRY